MNNILNSHPNHKIIFATHDIWERKFLIHQIIRQHDNIVLSNSGHSPMREVHFIETGPGGGVSQNFVADYSRDTPEIMLLRYYVFRPLEDKVYFYTFSPVTNEFEVDESSQGTFDLIQADP